MTKEKYKYPSDNWGTYSDNGKIIDINLFSDGENKYLAMYGLDENDKIDFNNCIAHYKLKEDR